MRISDWSSDVCSSDLLAARCLRSRTGRRPAAGPDAALHRPTADQQLIACRCASRPPSPGTARAACAPPGASHAPQRSALTPCAHLRQALVPAFPPALLRAIPGEYQDDETTCRRVSRHVLAGIGRLRSRSEEHTSELQSLMRTSYTDFC